MQNVSEAARALAGNYAKVTLRVYLDGELSPAGIGAATYSAAICGTEAFGIGNAVSAGMSIVLDGARQAARGQSIAITWDVDGAEYPLLTGQVDTADSAGGKTSVVCHDQMYFAGASLYEPPQSLLNACTAADVLGDIAGKMGVEVDEETSTAAAAVALTAGLENLPAETSCSAAAGYMAALMGGNAIIDRSGRLAVRLWTNTGVSSGGYAGELTAEAESFSIHGVTFTREDRVDVINEDGTTTEEIQTVVVSAGAGGIGITNPFATQGHAEAAWAALADLSYYGGSFGIPGGILLEPGDLLTVETGDGAYPVLATGIKLSFDGGVRALISSAAAGKTGGGTGAVNQALKVLQADVARIRHLIAENAVINSATVGKLKVTQELLAEASEAISLRVGAVESREIGGRNLLPDTRTLSDWVIGFPASTAVVIDSEGFGVATFDDVDTLAWRYVLSKPPIQYSAVQDRVVTLSCWIRSDSGQAKLTPYGTICEPDSLDRTRYGPLGSAKTAPTEWTKVSWTQKISADLFTGGEGDIDSTKRFRIMLYDYTLYSMEVKQIKLELGDVATDWTPAPEDAEGAISAVDLRVDSIGLSVKDGTVGKEASIVLSVDGEAQTGTIDLTGAVSFTDLKTKGKTSIHGGSIQTGTITAEQIDVDSLFAENITASGRILYQGESMDGDYSYEMGMLDAIMVMHAIPTDNAANESGVSVGSGFVSLWGPSVLINGKEFGDAVAASGYVYEYRACADDAAIDAFIQEQIDDSSFAQRTKRNIVVYPNISGTTLTSGYSWFLEIWKGSATYGTITAYGYASGLPNVLRRVWASGTLGQWLWENPPMTAGKEYPTTERRNGVTVCRKRISYTNTAAFGTAGTVTNVSIPHGIDSFGTLVRCTAKGASYPLPHIGTTGHMTGVVNVDATNITLRTLNAWAANVSWDFDLAYTKS